jgi:hypothetical protein
MNSFSLLALPDMMVGFFLCLPLFFFFLIQAQVFAVKGVPIDRGSGALFGPRERKTKEKSLVLCFVGTHFGLGLGRGYEGVVAVLVASTHK